MNYCLRSTLGVYRLWCSRALALLLALFLWQCGSDDNSTAPESTGVPNTENSTPADDGNNEAGPDQNNGAEEESTFQGAKAILNGQYINRFRSAAVPDKPMVPSKKLS